MPSAPPCALVIFGASGDLAQRKLIPAIYELAREKLLSEKFALVGYSRTPKSDDDYRKECREAVTQFARTKPLDESIWSRIERSISYVQGDYGSAPDHAKLADQLSKIDQSVGTAGNRLFYLSTPPNTFEPIIQCLGEQLKKNPAKPSTWQRVIIEKPFGHDLASAKSLNELLHKYFAEDQVFRIDHYLGKETVQNLLVMRFANT